MLRGLSVFEEWSSKWGLVVGLERFAESAHVQIKMSEKRPVAQRED